MREVLIKRDGKEYALTEQEMLECARILRINFYLDELDSEFSDIIPEEAQDAVADRANDIYVEAKCGYTEYGALEAAIKEYEDEEEA